MKNFIKTVGVTSCLVAAMGTSQAFSQTRYPDWASNGPALIGAKNGIAPLDGNGMMPAPVSGDSSASPTQSKYATFGGAPGSSRTMADRFGDMWNLKDFGMKMDASDADAAIFNALLVPTNTVFTYSNGSLPSSDKLNTKSQMGLVQLTGPNATISPNIDGWVFEGLGDGKQIVRNVSKGIPSASTVNIHSYFAYAGTAGTPQLYNASVIMDSGKDAFGNIVTPKGGMVNFNSSLDSWSTETSGNGFDVNGQFISTRHGTWWQWPLISVIHEPTSIPLVRSVTQEWLHESDYGAWGSDGGSATRHGDMITGWQEGGGFGRSWAASHAYSKGDTIEVPVNGIAVSVTATVAGTSGATAPAWDGIAMLENEFISGKTPSTITDGTVTWAYNGILRTHISSAYDVSYQPDNYTGYQDADLPANSYGPTARTPMVYGSYLLTDAVYDGPVLDFSNAQFVKSLTNHIWARVPADSYIDLSSQYGNTTNDNLRLFGYDSSQQALSFKSGGSTVFSVSDTGSVAAFSESRFAYTTFSDPDVGVARDAKFGDKGIAVSGGIKTDSISTASQTYISVTFAALPASPKVGQYFYCSDCYSKLREDSDAKANITGMMVYWNGSRWNDVLGIEAQH